MKPHSTLYCFNCRSPLNHDDNSFVEERDLMWHYDCAVCGELSSFSLEFPVPVRVAP